MPILKILKVKFQEDFYDAQTMFKFVSKQQASEHLNLSFATLKKYRLDGTWIEGTHWVRINSRCVRYNLELIQDWLQNRHDPIAHHRAIDVYHASLLSNQKRSNRRANSI
ncbi:helix-turn-helix transcriptional regulator [Pelatocladus sp. BLCC-F211]|uniref:helix-turn-helix transcriptional regulator n=1 Tax=Pelatocladus sp. BLCC-F211 TaxID=3342752 RepID=UPI0035BA7381